jgi:hypothetical protein
VAEMTKAQLVAAGAKCAGGGVGQSICTDTDGHDWMCDESTGKCIPLRTSPTSPRASEANTTPGRMVEEEER